MRKQQRQRQAPAHQAGQRMQSQICLAAGTVCGCSLDTHPRGWVRRAGNTPPCAASFFPYSFFAGEERIWPPEGASLFAWKILRRSGFQPRKKAIKPLMQCVSYSAAASGLHTGYRARMRLQACLAPRTVCGCSPDAVCRGGFLGQGDRPPALSGVFLPLFFLRYRRKNRAPGGR